MKTRRPLLCLPLLAALALTACGKQGKLHLPFEKVVKKSSSSVKTEEDEIDKAMRLYPTPVSYAEACRQVKKGVPGFDGNEGVVTAKGAKCAVRVQRAGLDAGSGEQLITESLRENTFLVATGSAPDHAAIVTLNGEEYLPIPGRKIADKSGRLAFHRVREGAQNVQLEIWECYNRALDPIGCTDSSIP